MSLPAVPQTQALIRIALGRRLRRREERNHPFHVKMGVELLEIADR
jgi:hypothetical protein